MGVTAARTVPTLGHAMRYDAETEAKLERFPAAIRNQDFATADAIRNELRAKDIDADTVTAARTAPALGHAMRYDAETEAKLERFAAAIQNQDFATADAIRNELRAQASMPTA